MHYFIITGASRGIGGALAAQLIAPDNHLFCISRNKNERLISQGGNLDYYELDLNNLAELERVMAQISNKIDAEKALSVSLINNAAIIAPLSDIDRSSWEQVNQSIRVNLLAPMILTAEFIRRTSHLRIEKRIMNISSGSAKHLVPGLSCYSTAKSGLDTFTRCIGIEQDMQPNPVKIMSVWPGMIETALQDEAINADKEVFAASEFFGMAREHGMLATPEDTAARLLEILRGDNFPQGIIIENIYE